jgi:thiamine-phosphate pyrophosphorylase
VVKVGRLHVITDEELQSRFSHEELAGLAVAGGADVVQLREKRYRTSRQLMGVASAVAATCAAADALFVLDDRVDVAAAVGARAVHLGRDDLPVEVARRLLGNGTIIGGTANGLEEALKVTATPVDYLGVGPVFGTRSKADPAPLIGLDVLRRIVEACPIPVVAIGGITPERVRDVLETGAHGVAVLSGVVCQPDPEWAARRYRDAIDRALAVGRSVR